MGIRGVGYQPKKWGLSGNSIPAIPGHYSLRYDDKSAEDCPHFSIKELPEVLLSTNMGYTEVYRLVLQHRPGLLFGAFNVYLKEGMSPSRWKVARLW